MKTMNIHSGKNGFAVTEEKYAPIRKAILASLTKCKDGLTFQELCEGVKSRVPMDLFPRPGSVSWYTKVVQLDMEARAEIARVADVTPVRIRRVR